MNQEKQRGFVAPRTGEKHGLFGVRFLKHHNLRDVEWTAEDLITQYEKLSNIFRKANNVADLQKERKETETIQRYKYVKKEFIDDSAVLKTLLRGDVQRTKNVLQDHPKYQRMFQYKQSYEVADELDYQEFLKQKKLDLYSSERHALMRQYEESLLEVALKQETIRYYDIKEFQEERDTKKLYVELKNSETRSRAIQKINSTYKKIIDQLLHDSLYYQPVLEALNSDRIEQTMLVKQTYDIGFPAIQNVKKLKRELMRLHRLNKREEEQRFEEVTTNRQILKEHPKTVKTLVRHDSDFDFMRTRYDRDTKSMTNLKAQTENVESTIKMLKSITLSGKAEEIFARVEKLPESNEQMKQRAKKQESVRDLIIEKEKVARFVHELLIDDLPQIYNDEKLNEVAKLQNSINLQSEKQKTHLDHMTKRSELSLMMRLALQHMLDVLRHVGTPDAFKALEYPTIDLKLPLLKFNSNLPPTSPVMETNTPKLLSSLKSRVQLLMKMYQKQKDPSEATAKFQQAMIEDSMRTFRPRKSSFDFN